MDPPYGMPLDWRSSAWTPAGISTHSVGVSFPLLPLQSAAGHQPHHVGFSQRLQGSNPHGSAPQHTVFTSPSSWDPPATRMETRGPSSPSSPYAYDPLLGRPLTLWDLPRPRIESYGGGGSSQYVYGASIIHGGGDYAPYSHHGGGYSGVSYANEHNPYAPSPPPPRDGYYVSAPQPNPPSYTHPQQSWELPWSRTAPDSFHIISDCDPSSTHAHGTIMATEGKGVNLGACAESEAGVDDGVVALVSDELVRSEEGDALNPEMDEVGEEKGDFVANDSEFGVKI